jgi:glycosyltransferase involved in cell wall biosynthesis
VTTEAGDSDHLLGPAADPWLTVVTVVRNDAEALARTLGSVATQHTELFEHLVVDGASTDSTLPMARAAESTSPWLRVVSAPDSGIYNAMNSGIRLARGSHLLFLNAGDDFSSPNEVAAVHLDWIRVRYEWGRYRARFVDAHRQATRPLAPAALDVDAFLRGEQERYHQGAIMSREMLLDLGGFDERYRIVADFDLMRRALLAGYRPWISDRIITDYDASGLSAVAWRESLSEENRVRTAGANPAARAQSWALYRRREATIGARRAARRLAEGVLGTRRVSALRSTDRALRGRDHASATATGADVRPAPPMTGATNGG